MNFLSFGASEDFAVFDDPRVIQAMAECKSHRVLGIGHTGTSTLLHLGSDENSNTPAQAGLYVRERIEAYLRRRDQAQQNREVFKKRLEALEQERDSARFSLMAARKEIPVRWITAAFLAGAIIVWLVNRLSSV